MCIRIILLTLFSLRYNFLAALNSGTARLRQISDKPNLCVRTGIVLLLTLGQDTESRNCRENVPLYNLKNTYYVYK